VLPRCAQWRSYHWGYTDAGKRKKAEKVPESWKETLIVSVQSGEFWRRLNALEGKVLPVERVALVDGWLRNTINRPNTLAHLPAHKKPKEHAKTARNPTFACLITQGM
jgi:hypothetical protein